MKKRYTEEQIIKAIKEHDLRKKAVEGESLNRVQKFETSLFEQQSIMEVLEQYFSRYPQRVGATMARSKSFARPYRY